MDVTDGENVSFLCSNNKNNSYNNNNNLNNSASNQFGQAVDLRVQAFFPHLHCTCNTQTHNRQLRRLCAERLLSADFSVSGEQRRAAEPTCRLLGSFNLSRITRFLI
ncbi:hypothetical protein EYF80_025551 [Liparis tanakae]|uniref:Uncharacterized protein n=1 Tax=Liparis tanakae TaxID=230148 RepID=A0A4Z2HGU2_9TELE|nr:hypothetical protein EYF80_025551 [Liparis tanakae]